jgi:hypothetical protein
MNLDQTTINGLRERHRADNEVVTREVDGQTIAKARCIGCDPGHHHDPIDEPFYAWPCAVIDLVEGRLAHDRDLAAAAGVLSRYAVDPEMHDDAPARIGAVEVRRAVIAVAVATALDMPVSAIQEVAYAAESRLTLLERGLRDLRLADHIFDRMTKGREEFPSLKALMEGTAEARAAVKATVIEYNAYINRVNNTRTCADCGLDTDYALGGTCACCGQWHCLGHLATKPDEISQVCCACFATLLARSVAPVGIVEAVPELVGAST